jgi:hypothetical protein
MRLHQAAKIMEFPSVQEFVRRYVAATPLAEIMADVEEHVRGAIADDVANDLKAYVTRGSLKFPIESHLLLACCGR